MFVFCFHLVLCVRVVVAVCAVVVAGGVEVGEGGWLVWHCRCREAQRGVSSSSCSVASSTSSSTPKLPAPSPPLRVPPTCRPSDRRARAPRQQWPWR